MIERIGIIIVREYKDFDTDRHVIEKGSDMPDDAPLNRIKLPSD